MNNSINLKPPKLIRMKVSLRILFEHTSHFTNSHELFSFVMYFQFITVAIAVT